MDLSDALGDWPPGPNNQSGGGGPWASQPSQPGFPAWPGQPGPQPGWPGGQPGGNNPIWQGGNAGGNHPIWHGGNPGGNPGGTNPPFPGQPSKTSGPLTMPYHLPLPRGVYDKLLITIKGTVKPGNPDKFTVDVCAGGDIAFHFNPRFNECGRRVIVCNSCFSNNWGREERDCTNFPFAPGQPFEMKILCTNSEFKVAVNGTHLLEYKHRHRNLGSIKQVSFYNDLVLTSIQMDNLP